MRIPFKITLLIAALSVACTSTFMQSARDEGKPVKLELRLAEPEPQEGLTEALIPGGNKKIYLHEEVIIANKDIVEARAVKDDTLGVFQIEVTFTEEGARRVEKITEENLGKYMAILFDGRIISAPLVQSKISDKAVISGHFTEEEAERIANGINSK